MDFKSVLNFFGGSIFSEEYIGDFTSIHQQLQSVESQAPGDSEHTAWVKLLRSIFSMLTGNPKKALDSLQEISLIPDLLLKWQLRRAAYDAFYNSLRLYPSIIRFKPSLGGPTASFRTLGLDFAGTYRKFTDYWLACVNSGEPLFGFENQLLRFLLIASLPLWNNAYLQHPDYPRGPWGRLKARGPNEMAQRASLYNQTRTQAINLGLYQVNHYLERLEVELEFGKSPGPSQRVESIKNRQRTYVDKHNLAIVKILEADHILSPPFSNPIALNLVIHEIFKNGSSSSPWETLEDELKLGDVDAAGQLYQQAYDLFEDFGSPRGRAVVLLRQGCVEHIQILAGNLSPEENSRRRGIAKEKFTQSLRLFSLDEAHAQIVRGHQILLDITSSIDDDILQRAADIGRWGHASSNEEVSRFVGNLMQRLARRQMLDFNRNDFALKCYKCAQSCFNSLGDRFGLFRALNSEMYLHDQINDHLAARALLDKLKPLFAELVKYIDKMDQEHSNNSFHALKAEMTIPFRSQVHFIYQRIGDTAALDGWNTELQRLLGGELGYEKLSEPMKDQEVFKHLFRGEDSGEDPLSLLKPYPDFGIANQKSPQGRLSFLSSMLPYLFADQKPSKNQISFDEYLQSGQEGVEKYLKASPHWNEELGRLNIDKANDYLRNYIREVAPDNIVLHRENFGPVFAAVDIGEFKLACELLRKPLRKSKKLSLASREGMLQKSAELENIIAACNLSQEWIIGHRILQRIEKFIPEFLVSSPTAKNWQSLAHIGSIYEHNNSPLEAFVTHLRAFQFAEQDRSFASDPNARRGIFSVDPFLQIFTALARLCLRANDLGVPLAIIEAYPHSHPHAKTWQEHAFLFLEQARARGLLEALMKRRLRMALLIDKPDPVKEKARVAELTAEIAAIEAELQDYEDEFDAVDLLSSSTHSTVDYEAISEDEIIIQVDMSRRGFILFAITSLGIEYAEHKDNWDYKLRLPVFDLMKSLGRYRQEKTMKENLNALLGKISDEIILPVQHLIREKKHVIFVASAPLTAFPFSALLLDNEPLFLKVAVSQAPSLSTLLYLWKSKNPEPLNSAAIERLTRPVSPLLITSAIEAMIIARTFNSWPLEGSKFTRQALQSLIKIGSFKPNNATNSDDETSNGADFCPDTDAPASSAHSRILHIIAHGNYNRVHPWLSYISLAERFRVLDIAPPTHSHRKLDLIVFAACLCGMGQATVGNDVSGFTQAMLERDCCAFLGALWKVVDEASMLLMVIFYRLLATSLASPQPEGAPPPQIAKVFQAAQKAFYNLTPESTTALFEELIEVLEQAEKEGCDVVGFVKPWKQRLKEVGRYVGSLDLKHPYYWAGWGVVGYGGLRLGG
ncbi:MAG: hypothetical protein MMC33_008739 [Icmadophila ericetorum]|nr:hypothetical protein [Icmadophila ericetorum]